MDKVVFEFFVRRIFTGPDERVVNTVDVYEFSN